MVHSGKVTINGIRIRASVVGEGAPVLMIHGWGASIALLQPLADRLSRLGYQCHLLDLPGFGESDEPPAPFSIFDYAEFCLAYLDRQKLSDVHYFGHSLGGRIGLILGSDHSKRIRNLVLSNSAGIKIEAAPPYALAIRDAYKSLRRGLEILGARAAAAESSCGHAYNQRLRLSRFSQCASPVMRQTLINVVNEDLLDHTPRRVSIAYNSHLGR